MAMAQCGLGVCTPPMASSDPPVHQSTNRVEVHRFSLSFPPDRSVLSQGASPPSTTSDQKGRWCSWSWQSLWNCDYPFQLGINHWAPWESCKPCLWRTLVGCLMFFPQVTQCLQVGIGCSAMALKRSLLYTGLGHWVRYKCMVVALGESIRAHTLFFCWGARRGCQCLRRSWLHRKEGASSMGVWQSCDMGIFITDRGDVPWLGGSV